MKLHGCYIRKCKLLLFSHPIIGHNLQSHQASSYPHNLFLQRFSLILFCPVFQVTAFYKISMPKLFYLFMFLKSDLTRTSHKEQLLFFKSTKYSHSIMVYVTHLPDIKYCNGQQGFSSVATNNKQLRTIIFIIVYNNKCSVQWRY
jgi:hypothetical protein